MHQHRRLSVPVRLRTDVDPGDTTFSSPPAWVNSTIRRSTAAIQSMFSVPLSIAIFAPGREREPLDRDAELLGEVERRDDSRALRLGERAERPRRIAEHAHPQHPSG